MKTPYRVIPVTPHPSPNFNARKTPIDMVVLHYTGMGSLSEVLQKLSDPASEVSAHYVVDRDGTIYGLVDEDMRAWHAGVSNWQGQRDTNSRSIGIEIINNGTEEFTRQQMTSVMAICKTMMIRHKVPVWNIVGHSDVAPGRKEDPGPKFPWGLMHMYGVAMMPTVELSDYFSTLSKKGDRVWLRQMLTRLGYGEDYSPNPTPTLREMVIAFQSRFEPHLFDIAPEKVGIPSHTTLATLHAAVRTQEKMIVRHQQRLAAGQNKNRKPRPGP